jgi:hypothetical protein
VAPVDEGLERLLVRKAVPASTAQQTETIVQSRSDLLDAEQLDARSGELDGERDAIEAAADFCDRGAFVLVMVKSERTATARARKSFTAS